MPKQKKKTNDADDTATDQKTLDPRELAARKEQEARGNSKEPRDESKEEAEANGQGPGSSTQPPEPRRRSPAPTVLIDVPIGQLDPGYATPRVDLRATPRQAAAAKMLHCSLAFKNERFQGGRVLHPEGTPVQNINDGVRWLLDRLADQIEAETGMRLVEDFDLTFR